MSKVNDDSSYNGNLKDCKQMEFKKFQEVSLQIYKATSYYKDMHIWSSAQIFIINQLSNMGVEYQFNNTSIKKKKQFAFRYSRVCRIN